MAIIPTIKHVSNKIKSSIKFNLSYFWRMLSNCKIKPTNPSNVSRLYMENARNFMSKCSVAAFLEGLDVYDSNHEQTDNIKRTYSVYLFDFFKLIRFLIKPTVDTR